MSFSQDLIRLKQVASAISKGALRERAWVNQVGKAWETEAKSRAPGSMAKDIKWKMTSATKGQLEVSIAAMSLSEGSKPHNIPHAFGKDMPFGSKGKFAGTFHPGVTKPSHFLDKAYDSSAVQDAIGSAPFDFGNEIHLD